MRVRVPSKLMIAGEYSVLGPDGEALAIAVGPGLEASARPSDAWTIIREDTGQQWRAGSAVPAEFSFAEAALRTAIKTFDYSGSPLELCFHGAVGSGNKKEGLGGSASAVAATIALIRSASGGDLSPAVLLPPALDAHRAVQQGRGSGYDVATIIYGGIVRWRPARVAGNDASPYEVERFESPRGVHFLAGYSGQSASTTNFIAKMERASRSNPDDMRRGLAALGRSAGQLIDAFTSGHAAQMVAAVPPCHAALCEWDKSFELGIVTNEVQALISMADRVGAVAKVSGAGGGDSVLALSDDRIVLDELAASWQRAGYSTLPIDFGVDGPKECT